MTNQIDKAVGDLDQEDQSAYEQIRVALGDFADTPLGSAATAQAAE